MTVISPEEIARLEAQIRADPIKWAYWKLKDTKGNPWKARWYQRQLLTDMVSGVKHLAVRMGRRVGKSETMLVYAVWYTFHHKNSRILLAAPYESQIRLLFMRLNEFIRDCDELKNSVDVNTKNPFVLSWKNGGTILGFTVGATKGQAGAAVRGQRADFIMIDEADYIDRGGIDAVTAIALEDPNRIGIWVSSTPTGRHDFFYDICMDPKTGYHAYHYPAKVNPGYDEKMEGEFRATMTSQAYIHEIEAEFGEETVGVFNKAAVERARDQIYYTYRNLNAWEQEQYRKQGIDLSKVIYLKHYDRKHPAPDALRIIGVDWDKQIA
jgi:replicative DNA helicase